MRNDLSRLYRQTQMNSAPSGRQVEVSILEMASGKLRAIIGTSGDVKWSRELDEALRFNQKVWDVFTADWTRPECSLERAMRENLLSLAVFVKKRTFAMTAQPQREGLEMLVQLNDQIVDGLRRGMQSVGSAGDDGPAG
jgi:flagellar protein FlaF